MPENHVTDGKNIASCLGYAEAKEKEDTPYFYFGQGNRLYAVREGKWKLHIKTFSQTGVDYFKGELPLLFDLEQDPSEKYDLSEQNSELVARLQQLLEAKDKEIRETGSFY